MVTGVASRCGCPGASFSSAPTAVEPVVSRRMPHAGRRRGSHNLEELLCHCDKGLCELRPLASSLELNDGQRQCHSPSAMSLAAGIVRRSNECTCPKVSTLCLVSIVRSPCALGSKASNSIQRHDHSFNKYIGSRSALAARNYKLLCLAVR